MMGTMETVYKGFVSYVLFALTPLIILQHEGVCFSTHPGRHMYFLINGDVEQRCDDTHEARVLSGGAQFEQYALLAPTLERYAVRYTATVLSTQAQLYSLDRRRFLYVPSCCILSDRR